MSEIHLRHGGRARVLQLFNSPHLFTRFQKTAPFFPECVPFLFHGKQLELVHKDYPRRLRYGSSSGARMGLAVAEICKGYGERNAVLNFHSIFRLQVDMVLLPCKLLNV